MIKDLTKNLLLRNQSIETSYFYMLVIVKWFERIQELATKGKTKEISWLCEGYAKDIINNYL